MQVDERRPLKPRSAESLVVRMVAIRPSIPVHQQAVRTERIVIRSIRRRPDGDRNSELPRLEDTLRRNERNPLGAKRKSGGELHPRKHFTVRVRLHSEPLKGGRPNCLI